MKKVRFSEDIGSLVDAENKNYNGTRFCTISGQSLGGHYSQKGAEIEAESELIKRAEKCDADAYEIISSHLMDSRQEYDATPYTTTVTAILYKN